MFQFLARFTEHPGTNITGYEKLRQLMDSGYSTRKDGLRTLIKFIKEGKIETYLLRVTWPIVTNRSDQKHDRKHQKKPLDIAKIYHTEPKLEIVPFTTSGIIRAVLARARRMFEELFQVN